MNKVITINLNGVAYQLEEAGYEALRSYLDNAARQLASNPDKDEIIADMEQAIGDKCRALLSAYRTVVSTREIEQIISEMGPVDTGTADDTAGTEQAAPGSTPPPPRDAASTGSARRLYRLQDGAMLGGVCSGIAAYFAIDPALVRILFVVLAFITFGGMVIAYLLLTLILPTAETAAEKSAAHGTPSTARDFVRRAREGYYEAARTFGDKAAHREWRRRFKREMRAWRHNFRREMHAHSGEWRQNWQRTWGPPAHANPGLWFALPFVSLIRAAAILILIFGILSLLHSGTFFGLGLPLGLPVWAAIVLLILFYNLVFWPIRAVRHMFFAWGGPPYAHAFFSFWNAVLWIVVFVFILWFVQHHQSQVHDALMNIKPTVHHAIDSIRRWWNQP